MPRLTRLSPLDVVVALRLTSAASTIVPLAEELGVAPSQVHASLQRLGLCGLMRAGQRAANPRALMEFLLHGLRYVFPAQRGPITSGIPTAYSAPPLSQDVDAVDVVVWPAPMDPAAVQGFGVPPLYPAAPTLATRSPSTYQLVAIADALRLGDPRVRVSAKERLESALGARA